MPPSKPPKKSEMLEVRLSYEDKKKLQAKARQDGVSVSETVRRLISNYLAPSESRTTLQRLKESIMKNHLKTKSALAAAGIACIGALTFAPLSAADEVGLKLQGSSVQSLKDGTRTRNFETEILIDEGKTIVLGLDGGLLNEQNISEAKDGDLMLTLRVDKTEEGLVLDFKIHQTIENENGVETKLVAKPKLTTSFDTESKIVLNLEENETLSLLVTAQNPEKPH
jgi:hypothetical protein